MYGIIQPTLAKLHLLLHPPLVEDHLVWETIFIWIQVRSLKRGTTVLASQLCSWQRSSALVAAMILPSFLTLGSYSDYRSSAAIP